MVVRTLAEMQGQRSATSVREVVITATRALVGVAARSLAEVNDDVTLPQYRVLVLLDGRGPQTMGELAEALGEVSADAWTLGWPIEQEAGDGSNS